MTTLQESHNSFADTYERNRGQFDMGPVFEDFWQRLDMPGGAALDLGCGAGEPFARTFIERGWRVTGVDFSARMLQLAERYVPDMQRIHVDFMGQSLYYSHDTPEQLRRILADAGFSIEREAWREIGGETFLWVTAAKL